MMIRWTLTCALCLTLPAFAQSRAYKDFFAEGTTALDAGNYQTALEKFNEAFRQEPKAGRYRTEGVFFAEYLPRYFIALAHDGLGDALEAEAWIKRSKEALEEDVIRDKDKKAKYFADSNRITAAAETFRQNIANNYAAKLREADSFLAQNRFDEASTAYQALADIDPSKPDSAAGMQKVVNARSTYLKERELSAKSAILDKDFVQAEDFISQIAALDPTYAGLPSLRSSLADARNVTDPPADSVVVNDPPPDPFDEDAGEDTPIEPPEEVDTEAAEREAAARREALARQAEAARRQAVREALLDSLKPYRRGDAEAALKKLEEIDAAEAESYSSYHWLKAVYMLTIHQTSAESNDNLKTLANDHLVLVARDLPDFAPDPNLYPDFIIQAYEASK